jgi:hypothetical protein
LPSSLVRRFQPFLVTFDLAAVRDGRPLPAASAPDPRTCRPDDPRVLAYERHHGLGHYDDRARLLRITIEALATVTRFDADAAEVALRAARAAAARYWLGQRKRATDEHTRRRPTHGARRRLVAAVRRERAELPARGAEHLWIVAADGEVCPFTTILDQIETLLTRASPTRSPRRGRGQPRGPWVDPALRALYAAGVPRHGLPGYGQQRARAGLPHLSVARALLVAVGLLPWPKPAAPRGRTLPG